MGSIFPPRRTAGFVTTCCIWRSELITLILEILLLRGVGFLVAGFFLPLTVFTLLLYTTFPRCVENVFFLLPTCFLLLRMFFLAESVFYCCQTCFSRFEFFFPLRNHIFRSRSSSSINNSNSNNNNSNNNNNNHHHHNHNHNNNKQPR